MPARTARWAARKASSSPRRSQQLRARGIDVIGPLPPDTMFTARSRKKYDAAICMYHDQALIPLKTLACRWRGERDARPAFRAHPPDHGTALDLAGKGVADRQPDRGVKDGVRDRRATQRETRSAA